MDPKLFNNLSEIISTTLKNLLLTRLSGLESVDRGGDAEIIIN